MAFSRQNWVTEKKDVALRLAGGECGGSYAEGAIILSAIISAIAAEAWPGDGIDRVRFVEIIKDYCEVNFNPALISIRLLIGHLRDKNRCLEARALQDKFIDFQSTRVLTGSVDRAETDILLVCPNLILKEIRSFSYPAVFYKEVRCSYMHEYRIGNSADTWAIAATEENQISYCNWVEDPDRHIHFPLKWIAGIAESIANVADQNASKFPLSQPATWWING